MNFTLSVLTTKTERNETKPTATAKGHKETFGGDVNVFYLDCGDDDMSVCLLVKFELCSLIIGSFLCFVLVLGFVYNYTSRKLGKKSMLRSRVGEGMSECLGDRKAGAKLRRQASQLREIVLTWALFQDCTL